MDIRRHHGRQSRLETRELKVNGTLFRVHLSQQGLSARVWVERYIPPRTQLGGVHGAYSGRWLTIHDWN